MKELLHTYFQTREVKQGHMLEAEAEAKHSRSRSRSRSRPKPNLRSQTEHYILQGKYML